MWIVSVQNVCKRQSRKTESIRPPPAIRPLQTRRRSKNLSKAKTTIAIGIELSLPRVITCVAGTVVKMGVATVRIELDILQPSQLLERQVCNVLLGKRGEVTSRDIL
jgi:hypothetical protein